MIQKTKKELNEEFVNACKSGDLSRVEYLLTSPDLKEHANIFTDDNDGFRWACVNGHLEVIKYLLTSKDLKEHADIHADDDSGFRLACRKGHLDVVKYLLTSKDLIEHATVSADDNYGLIWACFGGHIKIVQFLVSDLQVYNLSNIKNIKFSSHLKITEEEVIEMIKTRDLKNQLYSEVASKNGMPGKPKPSI